MSEYQPLRQANESPGLYQSTITSKDEEDGGLWNDVIGDVALTRLHPTSIKGANGDLFRNEDSACSDSAIMQTLTALHRKKNSLDGKSCVSLGLDQVPISEYWNGHPEVFRFSSSKDMAILRLCSNRNASASVKAFIRSSSILVVTQRLDSWRYIYCGGFEGWAYIPPEAEGTVLRRVRELRRYEDWRGANYFFCNGRIMVGSDGKMLALTNALLVVPSLVFFICVLPKLSWYDVILRGVQKSADGARRQDNEAQRESDDNLAWGITATAALLYFLFGYVMTNLWVTALSDPGILPRRHKHLPPLPCPPAMSATSSSVQSAAGDNSSSALPVAAVASNVLDWKYCDTCHIYRPPRAKHCNACQNCVELFDHHCPWTGNCIAKRNYRYFLRFLIGLTVYMLCILTVSLKVLMDEVQMARGQGEPPKEWLHDVLADPANLVTASFTFFSIWSLISLTLYHMELLRIGQTTNEHLKHVFKTTVNPFDQGFCGNVRSICCSETAPSLLDDQTDVLTDEQFMTELFALRS